MLDILAAILISAMEPLNCDGTDEIPKVASQMLPRMPAEGREVVLEIREQTSEGYISSLFLVTYNNRIYLEGWFFLRGEELVICEIAKIQKFDNEGRIVSIWFASQKEM